MHLRVPDSILIIDEAADPWPGWSPLSVAALLQRPEAPRDGLWPRARLAFRHQRVRDNLPLQAADKAFEAWAVPLLGRPERLLRKLNYWRFALRGLRVEKSVVAATHFVPQEEAEPTDAWLSAQFNRALDLVNDFLVAEAIVTDDWRLRPLARADLPALAPVILEAQPTDGAREGLSTVIHLHSAFPAIAGEELPPDDLRKTHEMFRAAALGEQPFFPYIELLATANHEMMAGRHRMAVLSLGTAIEVLGATVVRLCWEPYGRRPETLGGALDSGFKNVLETHLAGVLNAPVDLRDPEHPAGGWWAAAYHLRNRVAHEGARPTHGETLDAYAQTRLFASWIGRLVHERFPDEPWSDLLPPHEVVDDDPPP